MSSYSYPCRRLFPAIILVLLFSFSVHLHADPPIVSAERRTVWSPGVPGGIPEVSSPVVSVQDYGADPSGLADSKAAFDAAVAALPGSGGVVFVPQGDYLLLSKWTIGKSGIVVRGEGPQQTRLLCDHTDICIEVVTYQRGTWQTPVSGYGKGSSNVLVADGSQFTVGEFAEIEQDNDPALMYTNPEWNVSWAENSAGQLFEVTAVVGNQVHFAKPIHYETRADLNLRIRPQGFVTGVGFEDFFIEKLQSGGDTLVFKNTAYCWVRGIESYHTRNSHIADNTTLGNEYRDSYFHHSFSYGGGGSGYGVEFSFHCTDGLCENNVFNMLRHAMMVQVGSVGCVFGYNYSLNPVQGDGETNLNQGWVPPDISLHGHWAQMNLFEGNVVQEIGISDYWGPVGPGNTFLRNRVAGDTAHGHGIRLMDHSHGQNVVGNVAPWWNDDGTSTNTLRHGEDVNGTMVWDAGITNRVIPISYYLEDKPAFFGNLPWPITGSDAADTTLIPAQLRLDEDEDGMPDPWEMLYFGGTNVSNGALTEDYDVDEFCDLHEYAAGTIPTDSASLLEISEFEGQVSGPEIIIKWQSAPYKTYGIEMSTNLLDGFTQTLTNGISANPPENCHTATVDSVTHAFFNITVE